MRIGLLLILVVVISVPELAAQPTNYDEAKVPPYVLPSLLTFENGTQVVSPEGWSKRRTEILTLFKKHVYGTMPETEFAVKTRTVAKPFELNAGIGNAYQIELDLQNDNFKTPMRVLILLPDSQKPVPVFVAYNFQGNHTVATDPGILIGNVLDQKTKQMVRAEPKTRGAKASRWDIEQILTSGFGLVTMYYGDVDPDFDDGFKNGVHPNYPDLQNRGDNWTSIGAWAWGLSRVADVLEHDKRIDSERMIVMGHSRLGKTSLWAGANDTRFAAVISNNSGCGGAAIARRKFGETVGRINQVFPHWFCKNHKQYNDNESEMPVDQHMLVALMAPRPVYVASAAEDKWADPKGEFLSAFHAQPVYKILGATGGLPDQLPDLNVSVGDKVRYHIRSGKHDVTSFDWNQFIEFANSIENK